MLKLKYMLLSTNNYLICINITLLGLYMFMQYTLLLQYVNYSISIIQTTLSNKNKILIDMYENV